MIAGTDGPSRLTRKRVTMMDTTLTNPATGEPFPPTIVPAGMLEHVTSGPATTRDIAANPHDVDRALLTISADRLGVHVAPSAIPNETQHFVTVAPALSGMPVLLLEISTHSEPWRDAALRLLEHAAADDFHGSAELVVWPTNAGGWVIMSATYTDSEGERWS